MCRVTFIPRFSVLYLLIFSSVIYDSTQSSDLNGPSKDFSRHKIVQPIVQHARTKREIPTTRYKEGLHHPDVTMTVPIDGEEYILDLKLNEHLIPEDHVISYKRDGETVLHRPKREELDICQYSGSVRNKPGSWAAVSTCHGVRGAIYDGQNMRYIQPAQVSDNLVGMDHYIYDHSDLNTTYSYGTDDSMDDGHHAVRETSLDYENTPSEANMVKEAEIRSSLGSNPSSRYIELVMVADHLLYQKHDSDITKVHTFIKNLVNIVNSYYLPVNIFLALKAVVVWSDGDEIRAENSTNISESMLNQFLKYRRSYLNNPLLKNDYAFLITCKKFEYGVVGRSYGGKMCSEDKSGGIAWRKYDFDDFLATVVAHEIGHNLGLDHDDNNCETPDGPAHCIMYHHAPHRELWSQGSLDKLNNVANNKEMECLRNKPTSLFESPTCGNGFLEPGEQCDCGLRADFASFNVFRCSVCCDEKTCKLRPGAECATSAAGECCHITISEMTCRLKPSGSVCRPALNECDLPEYCTGDSEFCPRDVFKMNSTSCGSKESSLV